MIVPRLDANPAYSLGDRSWSFDLGATSLYTVFDGNLGEYFSFSFSNHWFAYQISFDDTKDLYRNTWRADACNWVDWANVSLHLGNFALTLGKDYIHMGTFENDEYDFNSHWQLNSLLWNNYQVYQWGGSVSWTNNDENAKVMFQMTSDQLMEKPFGSRHLADYAYTLFGSYEGDSFTVMGSFGHNSLGWMGGIGGQFWFTDALDLTVDGYVAKEYFGISAKLQQALGEKGDIFVKAGYDNGRNSLLMDGKGFYGGLGGYWYPLRDSKDLRIHGLLAYNGVYQELCASIGITYALNLKLF